MDIVSVITRIARGEVSYALGRFQTVRTCYSAVRRLLEPKTSVAHGAAGTKTIFPDLDIAAAVAAIRRDAVFTGLRLPPALTAEIEAFCRTEPLFARHDPAGPRFYYHQVRGGFAPDGRKVAIGPITDPLRCPAVRAVAEDPALWALVRAYLGYRPRRAETLLYWSFASRFAAEERRRLKQHVIDYHYDVGGFNFVYVSFYIIDCTLASGAHVMVKGSHRRKPLRMLLGSAVASEREVYRQFGKENEIVIEGPAGTGFIQDPACYHRASPPIDGDRLWLQIRFS